MPITYYTQGEVDQIKKDLTDEFESSVKKVRTVNSNEVVRSWILYQLMPHQLTAKELRDKLNEAIKSK